MADVRLAVIALAACTDAGAQPAAGGGPVEPPAGWTAQPAIVAAASQALGKRAVDTLVAFAEPAMGCYAMALGLRGSGDAQELAEQVVKSLGDVSVKDVVKPTGTGLLSLTFAKPRFEGRLQARLANGSISARACWWSQREPIACAQACAMWLGGMP